MHFNEYLRSCRENNNLTQEQLVHDLYSYDIESFEGLDTSTLSKWERNITKPKVSRQVNIIKYFQEQTGTALPCWDGYSTEETENLICKAGMHNLIGKRKQLILDFPSEMMHIDDLKVYPVRNADRMDTLINLNMDLHESTNHAFTQISHDQFREWALHPSNLFLVCEYKDGYVGLFFSLRLKPEVFDKLLNFEMKKSEITIDDFASFDERGCSYLLSFYALNHKAATMLFVRYYAHLIANQKSIMDIGGVTILDEAKKLVSNMNLHHYKSMITDDSVEIESYRESLSNVLASENVVRMILSKQECPEE